jgi:hypothetical protein
MTRPLLHLLLFPLGLLAIAACAEPRPGAAVLEGPSARPSDDRPLTGSPLAGDDQDAGRTNDASARADGETDADTAAPPGPWVPGPSVCNAAMTLGGATAVVAEPAERFGAVSSDERTIAWLVASGDDANIVVADRDAAVGPFGAAMTLPGVVARDGVTLGPDGTTLVAVAIDRRSFLVYRRGTRSEAFGIEPDEAFAPLHAGLSDAERVGDPVFSYGELVLVYSVYGSSNDTVRFATRLSAGSPFSGGTALAFAELRARGEQRRRPTGIGSDFQTLFYWDEVTSTQKLARLEGTSGVHGVTDLGAHPWAQPNATCSRVYFGTAEVASAPVN